MLTDPKARTLESALKSGRQVSFSYDGQDRTVEVHAIGASKTGKPMMRAYQVDGGSISGAEEGWKLFSIKRIPEIPRILSSAASAPRAGYVRGDSALITIDAEL